MRPMTHRILIMALLGLVIACQSHAQAPAGQADSPRGRAPIDLSGQWVALVTEDWRFRMFTAEAGDHEGIPLSPAGEERAAAWNPPDRLRGRECRAFGVGGLMRMPTRLRIDWQGDAVLRIRTDNGEQTRLLKFAPARDGSGAGSLQGVSTAEWLVDRAGRGGPVQSGALLVETRDMQSGYFRSNGVPYSEETVITEHFELLQHGDDEYLVVISRLNDPVYMTSEVITSTNFRRETDNDAAWDPRPCLE